MKKSSLSFLRQCFEMIQANLWLRVAKLEKRTCCGDWMLTQFRSSTCSRSFTTSHTKSSGTWPKVSHLTCLGSRLAAERQIGKRAITRVFQCQMYKHFEKPTMQKSAFTNGIYIYIYRLFGTQLQSRYINMQLLPINLCTAWLKYTYGWLENSELIMYTIDGTEHELHSYVQYIYNITTITTMQVVLISATP